VNRLIELSIPGMEEAPRKSQKDLRSR